MSEEERQQVVYDFEEGLEENNGCTSGDQKKKSKLCYGLVLLVILVAIATITTGIVLLKPSNRHSKGNNTKSVGSEKSDTLCSRHPTDGQIGSLEEYCQPSQEAQRIGLKKFLKKCEDFYFQMFRHEELMQHTNSPQHIKNSIAKRYRSFIPTPEKLKHYADQIENLQREAISLEADEDKLKPKEVQSLSEMKIFLKQHMSNAFGEDFYSGGWMFGPNYFCFHRICNLPIEINSLTFYFRPTTIVDVKFLMFTFLSYNKTIEQHITNLKLGIKSGMVKPKSSCDAGIIELKKKYKDIIMNGDSGITRSWFTRNLRSSEFYKYLSDKTKKMWRKKYNNKRIIQSLFTALIHGVSKPIIKYYNFLVNEYSRHCPPDDVITGLASLPLNYQYLDGKPDFSKPTTGRLPLNNSVIIGKNLYKNLLQQSTTLDVEPDTVYKEGFEQLNIFYPKLIELARQYTNLVNESKAVQTLKTRLIGKDQWHGALKFPEIESNETAYGRCVDDNSAKRYCPVRWRSMEKWKNYFNRVLSMINPMLNDYFYFTGEKKTVPNCPIALKVIYSPLETTISHLASDAKCSHPTELGLPFFLDKYGPRYQEWSIIGHEARPGHSFQLQGSIELFSNPCEHRLQALIYNKGVFNSFIEGWALYAENPVLSDDVKLYENNLLQKIGMYKWQVLRAARLVIDVGLNYKGKNRDWALGILSKYALEDSDLARKEIARSVSLPGQATSYMVGRLEIMKQRAKLEEKFGENFDLKEFHYQILSLGQVPLTYLSKYTDRYMKCYDDPSQKFCSFLQTPVNTIPKGQFKTLKERFSS